MYDLFGIVNHYGPMGYGHYTAHVKNQKNDSWWLMNDSNINEETSQDNIITANAYILFYKRRN